MLKKFLHNQVRSLGLEPGVPIYTGEKEKVKVTVSAMRFNESSFEEEADISFKDALGLIKSGSLTWINVDGLADPSITEMLGSKLAIHPLVLEDMLNTSQRPKFEAFDDYFFVVLKMLYYGENKHDMNVEQVSLIIKDNVVLSFQEDVAGDVFGPLRERIRTNKAQARKVSPDYLAYLLIDAIVDNYFVIIEEVGEKIEALEMMVINKPSPKAMSKMHYLKQKMIFLRKSIWPLREVVSGMLRDESGQIKDATKIFLRDAYDHTIQVIELIETCRDMISGLLDIYLSSNSNKLNEIMKVLTMISTIFIPLSFMASFYGMNFHYMPELSTKWGYPALISVMITVAVSMLFYFRRRRWL
jgi:magnesium transporter